MFAVTNVSLESCTQAYATAFATMPALPGERALRPARLKYLTECRQAGQFTSPTWAVVIDKVTSQRYRANGQHSSKMLMDCPPEEYPASLMVIVEEYTTDDFEHDAVAIFDIFDSPRSARTNEDVMNLYRSGYPELAAVSSAFCVHIASGIAMFEKSRKNGVLYEPRKRGLYLETPSYRDFILWAVAFEDSHHGWLFGKPGVVAEMIANRESDPADADEFWRLVLTEAHPDPDHETRELTRTLREWASKPRVRQERFRKEAAKQWRRYHRATVAPTIPYDQRPASGAGTAPPPA